MLGTVSDHSRIGRALAMTFHRFSSNWMVTLHGSIWSGWEVMRVAPCIVNDILLEKTINYEIAFAWQTQYLVRLEGDGCCSAHSK